MHEYHVAGVNRVPVYYGAAIATSVLAGIAASFSDWFRDHLGFTLLVPTILIFYILVAL